jgi:hypothetical protein
MNRVIDPRLVKPLISGVFLSMLAACGAKTGLTIPDVPMDAPPMIDVPDSPDAPPICVPGEFPIEPAAADVVFALDRSGSMRLTLDGREDAPPTEWRWQVLRDSLAGAFSTLDDRVRVGAKFFPDETMPMVPPEVACRSSAGIDVPISETGETRVLSIFDSTEPIGGTPTAVAIAESSAALRRATSQRRFIVLATDGGPNCNSDPSLDPLTCVCTSGPDDCRVDPVLGVFACLDDSRTVDTIAMTARAGIPVFVIGIDDPGRPDLADVLDAMAVAGGRPRMVPGERSFYSIRSAAELRDALDTITGTISRCSFVSPSVPADESTFFIEIDGVRIPRGGWEWTDRANGEFELGTDACALAQRPGSRVVAIVDACPDF